MPVRACGFKSHSPHFFRRDGGMADAHGSGPCGSNTMRVQVPFSALREHHRLKDGAFFNKTVVTGTAGRRRLPPMVDVCYLSALIIFTAKNNGQ